MMKSNLIGENIHYYKTLNSTQDVAVSMAEAYSEILNGTVVMAERQDSGRGRHNRTWISPPGGLWFSMILKPNLQATRGTLINFISILAVCEAIESRTCLECKLKWPNDILINSKKVCGIIIDMATRGELIDYSVVGIGINVNVDVQTIIQHMEIESEPRPSITSLKKEQSGRFVNRRLLLKAFFNRFNHYFNSIRCEKEIVGVLRSISYRLEGMGKSMTIGQTNRRTTGELIGVCSDGSLLLRKADGSISKHVNQDIRT